MMKSSKTTVGCRMAPELKQVLEPEASERGLTLSAYIETLLLNRTHQEADVEKFQDKIFQLESTVAQLNEALNEKMPVHDEQGESRIRQLQEQVTTLGIENRTLKQEKLTLLDHLKRAKQENEVVVRMQPNIYPQWMSDSRNKKLLEAVQNFKQLYPHLSYEDVLLSAIGIVEYNQRKPRFLSLQLINF
jgi:predicted enzyme involved in methoxymalonyl-ACP biosynthesis